MFSAVIAASTVTNIYVLSFEYTSCVFYEEYTIVKTPEGAAVDNDGQLTPINTESYASMNMWGLTSEFMQTLEDGVYQKDLFGDLK